MLCLSLIHIYLSNFNALRTADEDVLLDSITDAGRVVRVQNISQTQQPLFMGLMIRKDWLDKDGLDIPKTLEDWEAVLTAFKENHGAYAPFALTPYYDMFLYGFNATTGFMVRDGKVIYSPTSENMKEALTVYSDWYKKGLIDPDFMAREMGLSLIHISVSLPCVVTFTKPSWDPRYPSIKRRMAANRADIPVLCENDFPDMDDGRIGLKGSPTHVKRTFVPQRKTGGIKLEGEPGADLAKKLYKALNNAAVI